MPRLTNFVIVFAVIGIAAANYFLLHSDRFSFAQQITIFLVSYFALRFMLKLAGFSRIEVTTAKYSKSSILLTPLLWLPVRLSTARLLNKRLKRTHPDICSEIISHVMSPDMLYGKKLIVLARK